MVGKGASDYQTFGCENHPIDDNMLCNLHIYPLSLHFEVLKLRIAFRRALGPLSDAAPLSSFLS